ncbi:MAG TPA: two-component sensor histidine kinase [Alphaproteobacteria bacterium]|nr:two-component sensor histidine kinase [Alphaproteobacteria bacterium]HAJ45050.1 two-component sensor histidine kinase [Alphaproteobacteria bacterium]
MVDGRSKPESSAALSIESSVRERSRRDAGVAPPELGFALAHGAAGLGAIAVLYLAHQLWPEAHGLATLAIGISVGTTLLTVMPWVLGGLTQARAVSILTTPVLAAAFCFISGGLASPFLAWFLIGPLEACATRAKGTVIAAAVASGLAIAVLAMLTAAGAVPQSAVPAQWSEITALLAIVSSLAAAALALRELLAHRSAESPVSRAGAESPDVLAEELPALILVLSPEGEIGYVSASAKRILGFTPEDMVGLAPAFWVHIADIQGLQQTLGHAHQEGTAQACQLRVRRKDGSFVWMDAAIRGASDESLAVVMRDATRLREQLTSLVEARNRAEEVSRSKSRFLASMSHELRTPLNAIIGFSDIIRNEVFGSSGNPRYKEYAGHIHTSGQHLLDMISDLLDMSKIEAGKFKLNLDQIRLRPLIEEAVEMVRLQADDAGVAVRIQVASELPDPIADRRAVKQILLNLLSNAVKFTPAQGRVSVKASRADKDLVLEVRDTGVGIPPADLERIGMPFEQADVDLMNSPHRGTGLGLSLVKALAALHGGSMVIESAPGDGTCVTVTLPLDPVLQTSEDTIVYPEKFRAGGKH